ncbi:hypothetical protein BESB_039090 [Besnoitia besnoiti]|uniref:Uncharacterized protein n=1 Tax=Besnoitia besnoiti TaxID=94643 RepID=A0A2A9MM39_BESBE|nr:hypothetical protein BESB_039090 [Besnoitia besnoiti]PFH37451.1 hypothetical protein BESB_039090 [Besnoitia besnoiti]
MRYRHPPPRGRIIASQPTQGLASPGWTNAESSHNSATATSPSVILQTNLTTVQPTDSSAMPIESAEVWDKCQAADSDSSNSSHSRSSHPANHHAAGIDPRRGPPSQETSPSNPHPTSESTTAPGSPDGETQPVLSGPEITTDDGSSNAIPQASEHPRGGAGNRETESGTPDAGDEKLSGDATASGGGDDDLPPGANSAYALWDPQCVGVAAVLPAFWLLTQW